MKFTVVLIGLLSISTSWASEKSAEETKDKREAPVGYPSTGHSSQTLQIQPSSGHDDGSTISIGAGYSVGGAKSALSYGGQIPSSGLQLQGLHSSGGHSTIQLPPITLQPSHGGYASGDISQLMSQLSHGLSTGSLQLQPIGGSYYPGGQEGSQAQYILGGQGGSHGQYILGGQGGSQGLYMLGGGQDGGSHAQYAFSVPKLQQYSLSEQPQASVPSYAAGTKGLGSYGTGPVLFNPADSHNQVQPSFSFGSASGGHSFGDSGISLGNSGHSFGPASYKSLGGSYGGSSKSSFKPSAFLGASVQSDSGHGGHGSSGLSTHAIPSFGHSYAGQQAPISLASASHGGFGASLGGFGGGSSKFIAPSYIPSKSEGFGGSLESASAFSGNGHYASPSSASYNSPTSSYGHQSSSAHASSSSPQYYISSSKHAPSHSFNEASTSFKGPISSHGMLNSFSSGPKYSFGGSSAFSKYAPKDAHGAYSESSYNTIKYSEELKPRNH